MLGSVSFKGFSDSSPSVMPPVPIFLFHKMNHYVYIYPMISYVCGGKQYPLLRAYPLARRNPVKIVEIFPLFHLPARPSARRSIGQRHLKENRMPWRSAFSRLSSLRVVGQSVVGNETMLERNSLLGQGESAGYADILAGFLCGDVWRQKLP
jgi:hypothetical protein